MALIAGGENPITIDGIPLDEASVGVDVLAEHTHQTFHNAVDTIRINNTTGDLLTLLMNEVGELLKALKDPEARVDIVAETGDLFHLWNDLFKLGGFSVESFIQYVSPSLVNGSEVTIGEIKQAAATEHVKASAQYLLEELTALWMTNELDDISTEVIGIIASRIFAVAAALDINVIYATMMKNLRNREKYNPREMNEMSGVVPLIPYVNIMQSRADNWNNGAGGDERFFAAFLVDFPLSLSFSAVNFIAAD